MCLQRKGGGGPWGEQGVGRNFFHCLHVSIPRMKEVDQAKQCRWKCLKREHHEVEGYDNVRSNSELQHGHYITEWQNSTLTWLWKADHLYWDKLSCTYMLVETHTLETPVPFLCQLMIFQPDFSLYTKSCNPAGSLQRGRTHRSLFKEPKSPPRLPPKQLVGRISRSAWPQYLCWGENF